MGCQRAIAEKIVTKGADYILAVKDNQPQLHEVLRDYFETAQAANFEQVPVSYFEETDAGHGRCEVRRHWLVKHLSTLPEPENWTKLQSIGMVESERHEGEKTSREHRYYITTLAEDAEVFGNAVRAHWGVENQLHWTLDVVFRELLHEKSLVDGMQIEPETFAIRLTDPNGRKVAPDRLSAGERQLLAVAILWGLAKASGRSLSIVIDTPMGRWARPTAATWSSASFARPATKSCCCRRTKRWTNAFSIS
jgi:DNA sulfur modification protein DndD